MYMYAATTGGGGSKHLYHETCNAYGKTCSKQKLHIHQEVHNVTV